MGPFLLRFVKNEQKYFALCGVPQIVFCVDRARQLVETLVRMHSVIICYYLRPNITRIYEGNSASPLISETSSTLSVIQRKWRTVQERT